MDSDIKIRIDWFNKKIKELEDSCNKDVNCEQYPIIWNQSQDILGGLRRVLDMIMVDFFTKEKASIPNFNIKKWERMIFFPIVDNQSELTPSLSKFSFGDLQKTNPNSFSYLESLQPYNSNQEWMRNLRIYSNFGHSKLLKQEKKQNIFLKIGDAIKINAKASVTMDNCMVNGMTVQHLEVKDGKVSGVLDRQLGPTTEIEKNYFIEGTNIDILLLCNTAIREIEKIGKNFNVY